MGAHRVPRDPLTKRIAGYRIGDPIAGGTVQTISADAVLISRPDGIVDVRLRDHRSRVSPPRRRPARRVGQPGAAQPPVSSRRRVRFRRADSFRRRSRNAGARNAAATTEPRLSSVRSEGVAEPRASLAAAHGGRTGPPPQ